MRNAKALSDYLTRLFGLINRMKMYGEELLNKREKLLVSLPSTYDNIISVIEGTMKINEIDPIEVVETLKGFKQSVLRHIEDGDVNEKAFSSLSIQSKGSSQVSGYKCKKPWKNKEKKSFVKSNKKPNVAVKNTGNKKGYRTCGNLQFGKCWFKPKCHKCDKFSQIAKDCRRKMVVQDHYAEEVGEELQCFLFAILQQL